MVVTGGLQTDIAVVFVQFEKLRLETRATNILSISSGDRPFISGMRKNAPISPAPENTQDTKAVYDPRSAASGFCEKAQVSSHSV